MHSLFSRLAAALRPPGPGKVRILTHRRSLQYLGVLLALFVLSLALPYTAWRSGRLLFTVAETLAANLAMLGGLMALAHYSATRQPLPVFLGSGLLGAALLDSVHAITGSGGLLAAPLAAQAVSASGSRWFLPLWLWLGVWVSSRDGEKTRLSPGTPAAICLGGAGLTLLCLLWTRLSPSTAFSGTAGHAAAAVLFFGAIEALLRRRQWPHDMLEHCLMLSLIVGFLVQTLFLGGAREVFDPLYAAAQHLKNFSYLLALAGLVMDGKQLLQRAERDTQALGMANAALQREIGEHASLRQQFQELAASLERRVEERTKQLAEAQQAAVLAKEEAEAARRVEQEANRRLRTGIQERLEVERALRDSESRLQLALSVGQIGIWTWDPGVDCAIWDDDVYRIFGQTRGEFAPGYANVLALIHPDDRAAVKRALDEAAESGTAFDIAYRVVRPDNSVRHVMSRATARDLDDATRRMVGTVVDVTEHKRGEEQLRQRSEELDQLVRVLRCLYEIARLLGHAETPLDLLCQRTVELLPLAWRNPHSTFARLRLRGLDYRSSEWHDTSLKRSAAIVANGETVGHIEIGFAAAEGAPEQDSEQEIQVIEVAAASLGRAIDYKSAMEGLRRSEKRYRGLFDHMISGCALHEILVDETGKPVDYRFLEVNAAFEKLLGLRAAEIVGKTGQEVLPGLEPQWLETYGRVALSGEPAQFELHNQLQERHFRVAVFSPEKGRFALILNDITEAKQATEQLARERNLLRTLIDNLPDSIYTKDTAGRYLANNRANLRVLGVAEESQVHGKTVFDFFPTEHARLYATDDRAVIDARSAVLDREEPYYNPAGELRFYSTTKIPLFDIDGTVIGLVGISRDITERKRAEEALRLAQFSLDRASDSILWVGPDSRLLYVNDAACASLGYRREQLLSMKVGDFDERSRNTWEKAWEEVKRAGAVTVESVHKTAKGEGIPVEVNVNYLNFDGKEYHCAFVRDITARKLAEETLRESRRRMETLLSNLPGMAYRRNNDPNWTMEFVSKGCETLTGFKPAELLDRGYADIIDPADRARVWDLVQQAIEERKPFQMEYRIHTADGRGKWVWEQGTAIFAENGEMEALEGFITDISERRQAEEELERKAKELAASNAELEQFAYAASHDLQEPLRMIGSYSQLLARRYRGKLDSDADEFIQFIIEGADRMQTLIRDLLAYSRAGRTSQTAEAVDLRDCAEASLANLKAMLEENGAAVELGPLPEIRGQRSQLIQLFQNLIGNGVKYHGDQPPRVQVTAEQRGAEWLFTVRDNGIGIEPQYREQVFDLFRRLHGRAEYSGTGIGLAICKKIVENLGGRIWVDAEPGGGSAFRFTLPLENNPLAARQGADASAREGNPAAP